MDRRARAVLATFEAIEKRDLRLLSGDEWSAIDARAGRDGVVGRGEAEEDEEAREDGERQPWTEMPEDLVCKFPRCISVGSWRDP